MVPNIHREEKGPGGLSAQTEEAGIIGIIDGQLGQKDWNSGEMLFQGLAKIKLGQTGMRIATVEADQVKHAFQVSKG
jgi:hypothetical protein